MHKAEAAPIKEIPNSPASSGNLKQHTYFKTEKIKGKKGKQEFLMLLLKMLLDEALPDLRWKDVICHQLMAQLDTMKWD